MRRSTGPAAYVAFTGRIIGAARIEVSPCAAPLPARSIAAGLVRRLTAESGGVARQRPHRAVPGAACVVNGHAPPGGRGRVCQAVPA
jgi:hypothetical protein